MTHDWIAAGVLTVGLASAPQALAATPVSMVEILDRVRAEAGTQLGRKNSDIEITQPLFTQGLDELDLVELVIALEEKFDVELPDGEIVPAGKDSMKELTVQRLGEIVAAQLQKKR